MRTQASLDEEAGMLWQIVLIGFGVFMLWEAGTGWDAAYTRTFEMLAGLLLIVAGLQQTDLFRRR